jgi:DNA mismatch endonuclease, patch repair protein
MSDNLTAEQRRRAMARVQQKNTKPEIIIRSLLHGLGYRFRLHNKKLSGTPDIVLPKYKTVIFVHGCFWHQHEGCRKSNRPTSNVEYWNTKLDRNIKRDAKNVEALKESGWNPILVWECELKDRAKLTEKLISEIV